ncbi:MAG: signal peptidase I [Bacillota bacterium]
MFKHRLNGSFKLILITFLVALIIRALLIQPYHVTSSSMEPTLLEGDKILVSKLIYRFTKPQRMDIVVFKYPLNKEVDYVKRIIGLPGEIIEIRSGIVYIDGSVLEENYIIIQPEDDFGPVVIPGNRFFVLGDNRKDSLDSRYWGTVSRDNLLGKVVLLFWPHERLRYFRAGEKK